MSRIVVLGAAESGVGAAALAKVKGYDVFVSDLGQIKPHYKEILAQYGVEWEEGHHTEEKILNATEVVKSPGIPENAPMVEKVRQGEMTFWGCYLN
ncbi:MAG: UDP-N-acetylmuramoyl-L-alanine--D-glutamate ligase, partial [Bacteroidaceae bacterium]